jgi:hypothetical protein
VYTVPVSWKRREVLAVVDAAVGDHSFVLNGLGVAAGGVDGLGTKAEMTRRGRMQKATTEAKATTKYRDPSTAWLTKA